MRAWARRYGERMPTSAGSRLFAHLPRTAFKTGQSDNPRGREPGTRNKVNPGSARSGLEDGGGK